IVGLFLNNLWKLHVTKRWNRAVTMPVFVTDDEEEVQDYHRLYLIKHFFTLLNVCGPNAFSPDPSLLFRCPLQKLKPWEVSSSSHQCTSHMHQLLEFAQYADYLSLLSSQCAFICSQPKLLERLQHVTRSIDLYVIIDRHYEAMRTLLWKLINEGNLKHVKFSNISSFLSKENLLDLMKICAGIKVEAKLPKVKAFPEKRGMKRRRPSESSTENRPYKIFTTFVTDTQSPLVKRVRIKLDDPDESQCVSVETSNEDDVTICNVIDFTAHMENDEFKEDRDKQSRVDSVQRPKNPGEQELSRQSPVASNEQCKSHISQDDVNHEMAMVDSFSKCSGSKSRSSPENEYNSRKYVDHDVGNVQETNCRGETISVNTLEIPQSSEDFSETSVQHTIENNVIVGRDSDDRSICSSGVNCKDLDNKVEKFEAIPSCSKAMCNSSNELGKSNYKIDTSLGVSTSQGLTCDESNLSSCSRLPVLPENDDMASFLHSKSSSDEEDEIYMDPDEILLGDQFESLDELYRYQDLYYEALEPLEEERETQKAMWDQQAELQEKVGSFFSVDLPDLDTDEDPQAVDSLVVSIQEGLEGMEVPIQDCLKQVLPQWTNLRKLAISDAEPQYAVGKLDLSWTALSPFAFKGICKLIQFDNALTSIKLNGCFLKEYQIIELLKALTEKSQIQTVVLGGNPMSSSEIERELLLFLQNVKSLKTLHLNYTNLNPSFEFTQSTLLIRNIYFSSEMMTLHYRYNLIKVEDLLRAAESISSYRNSNSLGGRPMFSSLVLSGNRVDHKGQSKLRQAFSRIVADLEVDCTSIDITNPHPDHVAQM
ncbi:hypothetical protein FSP39_003490, partial [Pinctada imbricata]